MSLRLYALSCGWITMPARTFLRGEEGRLAVPVPAYLIDHPMGAVLFDSGLSHDARNDPASYLGPLAEFVDIDVTPAQGIARQLEGLPEPPGAIRWLVNSHLHFDHAGGNAQLGDAPVLLQRPEWEAARDPGAGHMQGYIRDDYDTGQHVELVDGEHDRFGDGSIVCLPTHGHTPGHQSLKVRLPDGDVVLCGDACYLRRTLETMHLPGVMHDEAATRRSLDLLRRLQKRGARIFYGHDPAFWNALPKAPAGISVAALPA